MLGMSVGTSTSLCKSGYRGGVVSYAVARVEEKHHETPPARTTRRDACVHLCVAPVIVGVLVSMLSQYFSLFIHDGVVLKCFLCRSREICSARLHRLPACLPVLPVLSGSRDTQALKFRDNGGVVWYVMV